MPTSTYLHIKAGSLPELALRNVEDGNHPLPRSLQGGDGGVEESLAGRRGKLHTRLVGEGRKKCRQMHRTCTCTYCTCTIIAEWKIRLQMWSVNNTNSVGHQYRLVQVVQILSGYFRNLLRKNGQWPAVILGTGSHAM